jgi:predicted Zn-dependent protease
MVAAPPPKSAALESFERLLAAGKDSALLRFSLGNEYLKSGDPDAAAGHLARAVALDPDYTAAWKLYGKALTAADRRDEAITAYRSGIAVAKRKGDRQAEKEMSVFLHRLEKTTPTLAADAATLRPLPPKGE